MSWRVSSFRFRAPHFCVSFFFPIHRERPHFPGFLSLVQLHPLVTTFFDFSVISPQLSDKRIFFFLNNSPKKVKGDFASLWWIACSKQNKNSRGKVSQLPGEKNYPLNAERVTPQMISSHITCLISKRNKKKSKEKTKISQESQLTICRSVSFYFTHLFSLSPGHAKKKTGKSFFTLNV